MLCFNVFSYESLTQRDIEVTEGPGVSLDFKLTKRSVSPLPTRSVLSLLVNIIIV